MGRILLEMVERPLAMAMEQERAGIMSAIRRWWNEPVGLSMVSAIVFSTIIAIAFLLVWLSVANAQGRHRGYYQGQGHYQGNYRHHGGDFLGGVIGGVLGSVLSRPRYYPPQGYGYHPESIYSDAVRYCMQRFRSYSPQTGFYTGYDGYLHPCP